LSEAIDPGITVTEIATIDQFIDVCPETTAAFVGRALRGPLDTPVLVENFTAFRRRFGGIWTRSSLGPAVKQFFEHGGKRLFIVRVANNARGAMLCLPASGSALVMRTVHPGSTEYVRAAVDYDGIADDELSLFNLTLQRVDPATGLITDQEFFRKCDWAEDTRGFVADKLLTSTIARVEKPHPMHRPERTLATGATYASTYIDHSQAGTDGSELSDYDLVGGRQERSGLFALSQVEQIDLLYLPPLGKKTDVGPTAILAAELFCRDLGAMLIVDPLSAWETASAAAEGVRKLGYASANMLGYFPRVNDRDNDSGLRPIGGAVAGLLCTHDRTVGPWTAADCTSNQLCRNLLPSPHVSDTDAAMLLRAGLNVVARGAGRRAELNGSVTLGRGSETNRYFRRLPIRRFCLQIINTVGRATRWAVFEPFDQTLSQRVRGQLLTYFECLNDLGAFSNDDFRVQCDVGVSSPHNSSITISLEFQPQGCTAPIRLILHQAASGCRLGSAAFARPPNA